LGGLLICLSVITANSTLVTSDKPGQEGCTVGGDLTELIADVDKPLLLISIMPDTQLKIKGYKNQHIQPVVLNYVH
jgi:hypothetical protein